MSETNKKNQDLSSSDEEKQKIANFVSGKYSDFSFLIKIIQPTPESLKKAVSEFNAHIGQFVASGKDLNDYKDVNPTIFFNSTEEFLADKNVGHQGYGLEWLLEETGYILNEKLNYSDEEKVDKFFDLFGTVLRAYKINNGFKEKNNGYYSYNNREESLSVFSRTSAHFTCRAGHDVLRLIQKKHLLPIYELVKNEYKEDRYRNADAINSVFGDFLSSAIEANNSDLIKDYIDLFADLYLEDKDLFNKIMLSEQQHRSMLSRITRTIQQQSDFSLILIKNINKKNNNFDLLELSKSILSRYKISISDLLIVSKTILKDDEKYKKFSEGLFNAKYTYIEDESMATCLLRELLSINHSELKRIKKNMDDFSLNVFFEYVKKDNKSSEDLNYTFEHADHLKERLSIIISDDCQKADYLMDIMITPGSKKIGENFGEALLSFCSQEMAEKAVMRKASLRETELGKVIASRKKINKAITRKSNENLLSVKSQNKRII